MNFLAKKFGQLSYLRGHRHGYTVPPRNYGRIFMQLATNLSKTNKKEKFFNFFVQIICTIEKFVVILQPFCVCSTRERVKTYY